MAAKPTMSLHESVELVEAFFYFYFGLTSATDILLQ